MTEEQKEKLLEIACDLCWYPTVISNPEWLEEKCEKCPMVKLLEVLTWEENNQAF